MSTYLMKQSAIVLFLTSLQVISTSTAVLIYYKNHSSMPKDFKYKWAYISLVIGLLSFIMGILSFFNMYIPYLYSFWVILFMYLNLIMTVIGILVFTPRHVVPIIGWIVLVIFTIVFNSLAGNSIVPLSPSDSYKPFTG